MKTYVLTVLGKQGVSTTTTWNVLVLEHFEK